MTHRNMDWHAVIELEYFNNIIRGHHAKVTGSVAELPVPIFWNFGMVRTNGHGR